MKGDRFRLQVLALSLFFFTGLYANENGERLRSLQQICIEDQSAGFNWQNGRWTPARFKETTYVVSIVEPPNSAAENRMAFLGCRTLGDEVEMDLSNLKVYNTCLMSHRVGAERAEYMACMEFHVKEELTWNVRFRCPDSNFYFKPNGQFHLASIHADVSAKPEDDYKDSLFISVGNCASFEGAAPRKSGASQDGFSKD